MTPRATRWPAWLLFAVVSVCLITNIVFAVLNRSGPEPVTPATTLAGLAFYLAMYSFAVAGVLIATRQPRNPIGWILLVIGLVWELLSEDVIRYAMVTSPGLLPQAEVFAVLTGALWVPGVGLIGTFLLLLFPDGHLPSPRWRWVAWGSGLALLLVTVAIPVLPVSLREAADYGFLPRTPNPLGVAALEPLVDLVYALVLLVPLSIVACTSGLIVRFRGARGREREQLKWLALAAAVAALAYGSVMALTALLGGFSWADDATPPWLATLQNSSIFVFALIPVAVAISILRHRLYDIDVIINRALVYGALTTGLVAVYLGGVLAAGALVQAVSGQERSSLAVAASTLAVAAVFTPLRRWIQVLIDRRFYRRRYDARRAVADFAYLVRDQVDLTALHAELVATVRTTIQPAGVQLWLKPTGGRGDAGG